MSVYVIMHSKDDDNLSSLERHPSIILALNQWVPQNPVSFSILLKRTKVASDPHDCKENQHLASYSPWSKVEKQAETKDSYMTYQALKSNQVQFSVQLFSF